MAAKKDKPKPRVVISGKVTTTPGTRLGIKPNRAPSITKGNAMAASPKFIDKAGKVGAVLKAKAKKADDDKRSASGYLMLIKEAKKLGNLQGPGNADRKLKVANRQDLDRGRTAARGKMQINNALRAKKKK
jgi:hypothetical protein